MSDYRWIVYVWQAVPGGENSDPQRVGSLSEARDKADQFGMDMGGITDVCGMIYPYSEEDWASAEQFRGIGNPFDYPTKVIEMGPSGGVRIINA